MFEVGKRYVSKTNCHFTLNFVVLAVAKGAALVEFEVDKAISFRRANEFEHYKEVPPEPIRYSTYQGLYEDGFGLVRSLSKNMLTPTAILGALLGYIRRDYEQKPGYLEVCVKTVLEPLEVS